MNPVMEVFWLYQKVKQPAMMLANMNTHTNKTRISFFKKSSILETFFPIEGIKLYIYVFEPVYKTTAIT